MMISQLSEGQAMDMGILSAAVRQAQEAAMELLHTEALKLNTEVVYLYGHGTRAYEITDVIMYDNRDFLYTVRPLSGSLEWAYDRRPFGTKPF